MVALIDGRRTVGGNLFDAWQSATATQAAAQTAGPALEGRHGVALEVRRLG